MLDLSFLKGISQKANGMIEGINKIFNGFREN